jgi:signal peptidase I
MPDRKLSGTEFSGLVAEILGAGDRVRFQAKGESMRPFLLDGDLLEVVPAAVEEIVRGDVVLIRRNIGGLIAHRVVNRKKLDGIPTFLIKGDNCFQPDGWFGPENILGRAEFLERGEQRIRLTGSAQRVRARMWAAAAPWAPWLGWIPKRVRLLIRKKLFGGLLPG